MTRRKVSLKSQPSSRTGENPPYGMIGRIEETSASFEARSAPRSYPTTTSLRERKLLQCERFISRNGNHGISVQRR